MGELLIDSQLVTEEQLKAALHEQKKWGGRLGRTLVEMGFVTESAMVTVLAAQLQLRTVDLDAAKLPVKVTECLRLDVAERYGVFPLGIDGTTLFVASSDPTNLEQVQEIEFATNKQVQVAVATASSIERAIRKYYFGEAVEVPQTVLPQNFGVQVYEFDERAPAAPRTTGPRPVEVTPMASAPRPAAPPSFSPPAQQSAVEAQLRKEISLLREQVDGLENIANSQVRALRALLEILIESGLVTRDEYLAHLKTREG